MAKQTIKLKKYVDIINEYNTAEELLPGMLCKLNGTGSVVKNTVPADGQKYAVAVILEDELQGGTITDTIESNQPAQIWSPVAGEEALLILTDAEDVAIGDLIAAGDGGLVVKAASPKIACAVALEALVASGNDFLKVRFI